MTRTAIRPYTAEEFPMIQSWWRLHHDNDFRPGFVPTAAYIVSVDGFPAGFFGMCPMTPDFSYFAFPMCNPGLPSNIRDIAIDFMIDCAKIWTAEAGLKVAYISIRGEKFLSRLREKGWIAGEDGCQHMFSMVGEIS